MPFWRKNRREPPKPTPGPRTIVTGMEPLIRCLQLSTGHHEWNAGATDAEIAVAEELIGRRLPRVLRALYEMSNGAGLVGGNLNYYSLVSREDRLSLATASAWLTSLNSNSPIPDEVVIFGDNGGDSVFGLWLPRNATEDTPNPVLEFGEGCESFAVAGTNLLNFFKGRVANYLLIHNPPLDALDELGLPLSLHPTEFDDGEFTRIILWADPGLPDPHPDPYERPVSVDTLRGL